ncbi:50S ribosomal protein L29 [Mesomycoplasma lagogenitalium]|uniref:Large ribosomal subunit protein uL29 n=1 Tax=Mesomycoplasma lagogenitalium TaxID=171286 RepID=A0ABY8LTL1_9BACT|nr:50S ribosomal protein L29 [Mesomycoplasma lagogenitalium]WGI36580.1 50S ribosomal protein L29 [Mesomycoplasma lagogenitalium]
MEFKELKNKSLSDLQNLVNEYKAELFLLRFQNKTSQLDKTHKISEIKKNIARVLTAIKLQEKASKEVK